MTENTPKQCTKHHDIPVSRSGDGGLLIVVAAETEARAVRAGLRTPDADPAPEITPLESLSDGVDLVVTGVGKAQAAAGTCLAFDPARHAGVLSLGIGGALPAGDAPPLGAVVLASESVFGDEGVRTPTSFIPIDDLGFPAGSPEGGFGGGHAHGMPCDPTWAPLLAEICDRSGIIATVSACSGTDPGARDIAERTGAIVENMEGAAVAAAISRLPVTPETRPRFAEIRVVSNTTGDRDHQVWALETALERLGQIAVRAVRALRGSG